MAIVTEQLESSTKTQGGHWRIIVDEPRLGHEHMALDVRLAEKAEPTLRFFTWKTPAISYGWKQPLPSWCDTPWVCQQGIDLVERPTGGGLAFHGTDVSVSLIAPRTLRLTLETIMDSLCQSVVDLCQTYQIQAHALLETTQTRGRITCCLTEPSPYALMIGERKVGGFAIRRFSKSWLIQGSFLVRPLTEGLTRLLSSSLLEQLTQRSIALSQASHIDIRESSLIERWANKRGQAFNMFTIWNCGGHPAT